MVRTPARRRAKLIPAMGFLCLVSVFSARSYGNQAPQSGASADKMKIKVGVDEVRLDVVVVDGKGKQITDLTADDFEVYQDRKLQEITSVRYISQDRSIPNVKAAKPSEPGHPLPAQAPKREDIRRTIVFLVNDVSMGFEDVYRTRESLKKYVNEQMQTGDLIAIFKTSRGTATLQAFSSDKRELLTRIENIEWKGMAGTADFNAFTESQAPGQDSETRNISADFDAFRQTDWISADDDVQLLAIKYCIKALENMPGRKYIMLITPQVVVDSSPWAMMNYSITADAALHAGVVIHTLDIKGLTVDFTAPQNAYLPLSEKTGGLLLTGFNFFLDGLGDVNEQIKGYYLVSYIPPPNTFSRSRRQLFYPVTIKVKRKGATVHTRDGFFADPAREYELPGVKPSPLVDAMFSPFQYNDLGVDMATGYVSNFEKGYLLPTWMHLDGRNLSINEAGDGSRFVSFKAGASTTDIDGIFQDYGDLNISMRVQENDIQNLREHGINFSVSIPVKKPGGHYVRAAVQDQKTGARGSAYQFIEIPDLKKKRLAISSLYIIESAEDADWIRSVETGSAAKPSDTPSRKIAKRNPAFKDFRPGDSFEYIAAVYNAKIQKSRPPRLLSQIILYKDGAMYSKTDFEPVDVTGVDDYTRIPFRKTLQLGDSMPPGDYVLQLLIRDIYGKPKQNLAAQSLNFRITAQ
jgi:VWFA-related protein